MAKKPATVAASKPKHTPKPFDWELVRTFVIAVLLAVVFRSFFFEPFHIPSGSMKDGLLVGDYIFVSKSSYGYSRYSFPLGLPFLKGRVMRHEPERGDVIVFRLPRNPRIDYIKRLVGLPGDKIQVKEGMLYINGHKVPRVPDGQYVDDENADNIVTISRYRETLPNGVSYDVLDQTRFGEVDNTDIYTVPEGHYFMMGDNRDNSMDSRFPGESNGVGFVPEENLVGRAKLIFFSSDNTAQWWEIWKWPFSLRSGRFFKWVR